MWESSSSSCVTECLTGLIDYNDWMHRKCICQPGQYLREDDSSCNAICPNGFYKNEDERVCNRCPERYVKCIK
jgi:hypothetical protein